MGFFNSNKNRAANIAISRRGNVRSPQTQNRRIIKTMMYDNKTKTNKLMDQEIYTTKKQQEAIDLGFTGYSLKYQDIMIVGDIFDMLPEYKHDIDPNAHNIIRNDIFEGILCDKVALIYSPKLKKFMYIALNDNYSMAILFKETNFKDLPYIERFDLDNLHPNLQIIYNVNRSLVSVYYHSVIEDMTNNPILNYNILEVFKK